MTKLMGSNSSYPFRNSANDVSPFGYSPLRCVFSGTNGNTVVIDKTHSSRRICLTNCITIKTVNDYTIGISTVTNNNPKAREGRFEGFDSDSFHSIYFRRVKLLVSHRPLIPPFKTDNRRWRLREVPEI